MKRLLKKVNKEISNILKPLGIPVYAINSEIPERIFKLISQSENEEVKKSFSQFTREELTTEIVNFYSMYMFKNNFKLNQDEFLKQLSEFLEKLPDEKTYEAVIYIPGIFQFPRKEFNSNLKTISFSEIKKDPFAKISIKSLQKDYKDLTDDKLRDGLWIKYTFSSIHPINSQENVRKYCINKIEDFLGIVSLLCFGATIDTNRILGFIKGNGKTSEIRPKYSYRDFLHLGFANYPTQHQKYNLSIIRKIFGKKKMSPIEQKLLAFSRMFLHFIQSNSLELKHIILISGIESLLLSGDDQFYIGDKTAEKTAILVGESVRKRIQLYHFMKRQYNARSTFVHEGKSNISEGDVRELESIAKRLFYKQLKNSTIYNDFSGENGLDSIFLKAKFK